MSIGSRLKGKQNIFIIYKFSKKFYSCYSKVADIMVFALLPLHCRFVLNSRNCQVKICRQVHSKIVELCQSPARHCPPARSPLTHNVRAAWRRRGVRYSSCGTQTFIFPLHFPRRYTPACAKPPVGCWHFCH